MYYADSLLLKTWICTSDCRFGIFPFIIVGFVVIIGLLVTSVYLLLESSQKQISTIQWLLDGLSCQH